MTEAEWLASVDPVQMVNFVGRQLTRRQRRLLAVASCHRIWHVMTDERSRQAVTAASSAAESGFLESELEAISAAAEEAFEDSITDQDAELEDNPGTTTWQYSAACWAASYASNSPEVRHDNLVGVLTATSDSSSNTVAERENQAQLIRDIFGNPFHPVAFDPSWRSEAVVALARGVYDDRAFDRLPVLADALEDAGCTDADILAHCRGDGPHVRGCWVVDLVLGKT